MGVYRHLLETPEGVDAFRAKYGIPDDVRFRLGALNEPLPFCPGEVAFPLVSIVEGGVRFPVHPVLRACLSLWHLCPCQLMPNGFKVVMGVVELNRLLGTDLGAYDIDDVYDVCRSAANDRTYYLRVKLQQKALVRALEDSNKYAGDDKVFFSGN